MPDIIIIVNKVNLGNSAGATRELGLFKYM